MVRQKKRPAEATKLKNALAPLAGSASPPSASARQTRIQADWKVLKGLLLPRLSEAHAAGRPFRAWVANCSHGEEAYVLAMLLCETILEMPAAQRPRVRIFASDRDGEAIAFARRGWYPLDSLSRFPVAGQSDFLRREHTGLRVRRELRELITFATHDLKSDPPFARLDLVVYRDDPTLSEAVPLQALAPLFHFSLVPEGVLLLSTQESMSAYGELFAPLDVSLYRRRDARNHGRPRSLFLRNFSLPHVAQSPRERPSPKAQAEAALLRHFVPPSVLVDEGGDILYFTGRTGGFLDMPADQPRWNVHACVHPELRAMLPDALERVLRDHGQLALPPVDIPGTQGSRRVQVLIQPVQREAPQTALIVFREVAATRHQAAAGEAPEGCPAMTPGVDRQADDALENIALLREMQELREKLGLANEELQSINEELVVTNDDLRTSNEQVQTMNEVLLRSLAESEQAQRHIETLSHRVVSVQECERRQLSGELHDRTSPNLASMNVLLKALGSALSDDMQQNLDLLLQDLSALLEDTNASIREICADLRPPVLDHAGLVPALESYSQQFASRTGIDVQVDAGNRPPHLSSEHESLLFRIVQEALTNCAKHSQAEHVHITLGSASGDAILTISDDGVGFSSLLPGDPDRSAGLGLLTMRERAEFAGGRFTLDSEPGQGTRIKVEIATGTH